jgi:hypothetical protein
LVAAEPINRPPFPADLRRPGRYYATFAYQAQSWKKPRRVVARVEWHPGELYLLLSLFTKPFISERPAFHVRRDKAALFQRVQAPPGERSSRKQPGQAWRRRNV